MLRPGYLIAFSVMKNMPDHDAYLLWLPEYGVLGQLPRRFATREYRVGENGWAAVFEIKGPRVLLSQKSPQYVRRVLEQHLAPLIRAGHMQVKRVAWLSGAGWLKVAVESLNEVTHSQVLEMAKPGIVEAGRVLAGRITLIEWSTEIERYVVNALFPAPASEVSKVIFLREMRETSVYVSSEYAGIFMGSHGSNVSAAAKLTGVAIRIIPI